MKNLTKKITAVVALALFTAGAALAGNAEQAKKVPYQNSKEKTVFQTSHPWKPSINNRADVAIIYGVAGNPSDQNRGVPFEERVQSWRDNGYGTHFMTGIAWGDYKDYFTGEWDGKWHLDEGQVEMDGDTIWHGRLVPYLVPSDNFLTYFKEKHIKRVIDAGITSIYLEEPEFWARAGYSEAFKREWQAFYGFPWRPQHESPENTYLANKLKYHLYYNALENVFTYAKEYGASKGLDINCYVPTHSLVNYSQWSIVSPEASLASMPVVDGYIAQIWTGTSREPNWYNGLEKERVFETAFLEYGSMESMTAPTGRKMYFLTDPIEDRAKDWADYKRNYEATFTAQLLYPGIADYEVMPWPERIYEGRYRVSATSDERQTIPRSYSTQMHIMINSLNDMPLPDNKVSGSHGISVLMANSLMFQRFPIHASYDDPQLANFYGQALPLLKRGVPVATTHIENLQYKQALKDVKVLLMTYSNMKPLTPEVHDYLAKWVYDGGIVIYSGTDSDPFQTVREWWNTGENKYMSPADHLFEKMGINSYPNEGRYRYGKGTVCVLRTDPKDYILKPGGDAGLLAAVEQFYEEAPGKAELEFKNSFYLERGPYTLISVLDESVSDDPYVVNGLFIDLYDPKLPTYTEKMVWPGTQAMLYDLGRVKGNKPQVVATGARVYDEAASGKSYSFVAVSPVNTTNIMRVLLPAEPKDCKMTVVGGGEPVGMHWGWDEMSKTCLIGFENYTEGVRVELNW